MSALRRCDGLVAVVTGASQGGTGTALAVRLAAEGARVAICARTEAGLRECAARIEAVGSSAVIAVVDLSDSDGAANGFIGDVEASLGPVDILVNNAAMGPYRSWDSFDPATMAQAQHVNVWWPWRFMQQCVPGMVERGRGWVLNMTSRAAELPLGPPFPPGAPSKAGALYGSTKAALNRLTVSVASEVEGTEVAVNALAPQAAILTPALHHARDNGLIHPDLFEPLEAMVEASMELCTTQGQQLHGRVAYSLDLLDELKVPVRSLDAESLVDRWQPGDIGKRIKRQHETKNRRPNEPVADDGFDFSGLDVS